MPDFTIRHPQYDAMARRWRISHDFRRGGRWVEEPDWSPTVYRRTSDPTPQPEGGEGMSPAAPLFDIVSSRYYLWKHPTESEGEYLDRASRAAHIPLFGPCINIFVAGILRTPPKRKGVEVAPWLEFERNADLAGCSFDSLIREGLGDALTWGRSHVLTDYKSADGAPFKSQADAQARGARAYCYQVSVLDIVDWAFDEDGRLLWVSIREDAPLARGPGERHPDAAGYQFRVWTRGGWELWRQADPKKQESWAKVEEGNHPVGEVPLSTMYTYRSRTWLCESPIASVCGGDLMLFNKHSELDTLERNCGFPVFGIPSADERPVGPISWGPTRAFTHAVGAQPGWYSPDATHARDAWERILGRYAAYRVAAGVGRGKAEESKEQRSAAAIMAEYEPSKNQMSLWAASVEECDNSIHRHAAKWQGIAEPPSATYERNFDLRAIASRINDLVQLSSASVFGAAVMRQVGKPIVEKLLTDDGESAEDIAKVMSLIDSDPGPDKAPETPTTTPNNTGVQ